MAGDFTISRQARDLMGLRILQYIEENLERGVDRHGRPLEPYSTTGFARPVFGIPKAALAELKRQKLMQMFTRPGGARWIYLPGGYVDLKRALKPNWDGSVDMSVTGFMLNNLTVMEGPDDMVVIGFNSPEAAERAYWHTVAGAGKSRVIRDFLGATDEQYAALAEILALPGAIVLGRDLKLA